MLYDLQAKNYNKLFKTKLVSKSLSSTCNTITAICNENSELEKDVYVGSTSKTLAQRLSSHKNNSLRIGYDENKLYEDAGGRTKQLDHETATNYEEYDVLTR